MATSTFAAINIEMIFIWGTVATILITIILEGSRKLGISRMSFTFMMGKIFTSNRDHAEIIGFVCNLIMGWLFTFIYALVFCDRKYAANAAKVTYTPLWGVRYFPDDYGITAAGRLSTLTGLTSVTIGL